MTNYPRNQLLRALSPLSKIPRSMKLSFIMLFISFGLASAAETYGQSVTLNINVENKTVQEVLDIIEQQSEFTFFYNNNQVDTDRKITLESENSDVFSLLYQIFENTDVTYKVLDRSIILSTRNLENVAENSQTIQDDKKKVTGTVLDINGETIIGASIHIKGTTTGTTTDVDGTFSLEVPESATLVISSISYITQEINITNQTRLNITLKEDREMLDEVVVVGYGTLDKRELTSSISSIKSKDFISGAMGSPLQAITGKITGLSVINENGADPNSGISMQLRGANSILAGQGPLIVIDGIPGGNINDIQKEDIVSIDVLKDASAASIYGTRASGGVVLITTKQATQGKTIVSYTAELTFETVRKRAEVFSAEEFLEKGLGTDHGARTDWFEEVTNDNPFTQRHALSFSGGGENLKAYTSLYYKDAEGMAIGSARREIGGRATINYSLWDDRLTFTGRVSYSDIRADRSEDDKLADDPNQASNNLFMMALKLNPTIPVYDATNPTGYNVLLGGWEEWNPVADVMLKENYSEYRNLMASLTSRLKITNDFNTTLTIGMKSNDERRVNWRSAEHKSSRDAGVNGYAKMESTKWNDLTLDWLFNYNKEIGDHSIKAVAGYSFQQFDRDGFWAENENFPVNGVKWWDMGSGTHLSDGRADLSSYKDPRQRIGAFLARVNYSYKNRYMVSVSARYEGISKLSEDNRWGLFPAISAGWRISSEPFMEKINWISDLKLRAGFGRTGNADFNSGKSTRMYGADTWWLSDGTWFKSYGLAHNVNTELSWETKDEINIGLDFAFFNYRLSGKIDVYQRNVNGLIYDISVPQPPAVHDKMTMNTGNLVNKGIEVELTGVVVDKTDWNYTTTIRASNNTTKLTSLWGSQTFWDTKEFEAPGSPGTAVRLIAGEDIGRFYIWKYAGIDDAGNWLVYDENDEIIPAAEKSNDDKRFIGNAIPDVILSWDNSVRYKNFDLSLYFRSWIGHDVFNKINMYYGVPNVSNQNFLKDAYEKNGHINGEKELCDYWLEDGTFLKLDAATFGYTFKIRAIEKYVPNIRVNFTARNVFCLTGYSGLDPEVNINGLEPGFEERGVYPLVRSFTLGLNFNF